MNSTKPTSLLGGPFPPELEEKWAKELKQERQMVGRVSAWRELLLDGYRSGDLGFEQYARLCHSVIRANTPDKPKARYEWLGEAIAAALNAERRKRGPGKRGVPQSIRIAALDLLEMIHEREGLPLSRTENGAYHRCCRLFTEAGYGGISPTELEKWRSKTKSTRVTE